MGILPGFLGPCPTVRPSASARHGGFHWPFCFVFFSIGSEAGFVLKLLTALTPPARGSATPHLRNGPDPHDAWDLSSRVSLVGDRTMWRLAERGDFGGLNYGVAQRAAVPFRFRVGGSGGEPFSVRSAHRQVVTARDLDRWDHVRRHRCAERWGRGQTGTSVSRSRDHSRLRLSAA